MPNQHASTKTPATYRLDSVRLAAVRARAAERGETVTSVIERKLEEYLTEDHPAPKPR